MYDNTTTAIRMAPALDAPAAGFAPVDLLDWSTSDLGRVAALLATRSDGTSVYLVRDDGILDVDFLLGSVGVCAAFPTEYGADGWVLGAGLAWDRDRFDVDGFAEAANREWSGTRGELVSAAARVAAASGMVVVDVPVNPGETWIAVAYPDASERPRFADSVAEAISGVAYLAEVVSPGGRLAHTATTVSLQHTVEDLAAEAAAALEFSDIEGEDVETDAIIRDAAAEELGEAFAEFSAWVGFYVYVGGERQHPAARMAFALAEAARVGLLDLATD